MSHSIYARRWYSVRRLVEAVSIAALVAITFWNIWIFRGRVFTSPPAGSDELVVQEKRYEPIRAILTKAGYTKGPIAFITKRDLTSAERREEDDRRWGQGQYEMVPWILVRQGRTVPGMPLTDSSSDFAIADFWDGMPSSFPAGFETLYDSGSGLMLLRRKAVP
jgi:hypothetical protein